MLYTSEQTNNKENQNDKPTQNPPQPPTNPRYRLHHHRPIRPQPIRIPTTRPLLLANNRMAVCMGSIRYAHLQQVATNRTNPATPGTENEEQDLTPHSLFTNMALTLRRGHICVFFLLYC